MLGKGSHSGMLRKSTFAAVFAGAAVVLGVAGLAWACTGQIQSFRPDTQLAAPGAPVTMKGQAAVAGAPVAIRWDGANGPQIATAVADPNGLFTATATVPDVAPGVYYLFATSGDNQAVGRAAFEVTATAGSEPAPAATGRWGQSGTPAIGLDSAAPSGSSGQLGMGIGLLTLGMAALFSGFALAAARRRAPADTRR